MEERDVKKVQLDEEGKKYMNVYSFDGKFTAENFASQTVEFVRMISDYKNQYRQEVSK